MDWPCNWAGHCKRVRLPLNGTQDRGSDLGAAVLRCTEQPLIFGRRGGPPWLHRRRKERGSEGVEPAAALLGHFTRLLRYLSFCEGGGFRPGEILDVDAFGQAGLVPFDVCQDDAF